MTNEHNGETPTNDANQHSGSQSKLLAPTPKQGEIRVNTENHSEDQQTTAKEMRREFRWFEFASVLINAALAVIGAIALCIYSGQLKVMRGQLGEMVRQYPELKESANSAATAARSAKDSAEIATRTMIIDQRPWVSIQTVDSTFTVNKVATATCKISNTGKTPALRFEAFFVNEILPKNQSPNFYYGPGHPRSYNKAGILSPNDARYFQFPASKKAPGRYSQPIVVDQGMYASWQDGKTYLVTYGRGEYCDIFSIPHWITFCGFTPAKGGEDITAYKICAAYNNADNNTKADPAKCFTSK